MDTNASITHRISTKIFVGYELNLELKINLDKSSLWKESSVSQSTTLQKVVFQNKNYIGSYLEFKNTTMKNLEEHAALIKSELERYCNKIDINVYNIQIFPQVFIR